MRPWGPWGVTRTSAPKKASFFSVWSRARLILDDGRFTRCIEAAEQNRRLDLCRRNRRLVGDGDRLARPANRQRHAIALGGGDHLDAHLLSRIVKRPNGALSQQRHRHQSVARIRVAADHANHQAGAGTGIAEIECTRGLQQGAKAHALHAPFAGAEMLDRRTSARAASAVRSTSSPSSKPVTRVSPTASRPKISARCEMDLSPERSQCL